MELKAYEVDGLKFKVLFTDGGMVEGVYFYEAASDTWLAFVRR